MVAQSATLILSKTKLAEAEVTKPSTTEQAEIYAFGLISTDVIRAEVERMDAECGTTEYFLSTPSWKVHANSTLLYRLRTELKRRIDAETFADLAVADAIHADTAGMWMEAAE